MKIIISESQYKKLNEQLMGLLRFSAHETNTSTFDNVGLTVLDNRLQQKKFSDKEQVVNLFKSAQNLPSNNQDWINIKPIADNMYKEMKGLGSGNFLNELKKIKTINQLAALVKNWNYDNESFIDWLSGEYTITWSQILNVLKQNFGGYIKGYVSQLEV